MSCILTLALDDAAQQRFNDLRERWFPPERNQIPAHLTLFHTLPEADSTLFALHDVAQNTSPFPMRVGEVRSLGRGVAFFLTSSGAAALHRGLRETFHSVLSAQDRQGFRPHVVVQNKVETAVAKETLAVLQAGFQPWECQATGMDLWRYLGGPWELMQRFTFSDKARS